MRITVLVVFSEQQHSTLAHEVHDLRCEAAGVINRTIDFQAITFADHKVVVAMARSGVHTTGASFTGDLLISRLPELRARPPSTKMAGPARRGDTLIDQVSRR